MIARVRGARRGGIARQGHHDVDGGIVVQFETELRLVAIWNMMTETTERSPLRSNCELDLLGGLGVTGGRVEEIFGVLPGQARLQRPLDLAKLPIPKPAGFR